MKKVMLPAKTILYPKNTNFLYALYFISFINKKFAVIVSQETNDFRASINNYYCPFINYE